MCDLTFHLVRIVLCCDLGMPKWCAGVDKGIWYGWYTEYYNLKHYLPWRFLSIGYIYYKLCGLIVVYLGIAAFLTVLGQHQQ